MSVLDIVSGLAKAGGQAYEGYGQDQQIKVKDALAQAKATEEARRNAVLNKVALAGIDPGVQKSLAGAKVEGETPGLVNRMRITKPIEVASAVDQAKQLSPITTETAAKTAAAVAPTTISTYKTEKLFDNANPAPVQPGFSPVVTTAPGGDQHVSKFNTKTGAIEDTGVGAKAGSGPSIPAGIRTKVAENTSTLATIGEAMKSLDAHPDAVGLTKNLPLVGKYADQRLDPEGVATRALIANVGSLQIHTRTGANMNIREEPRLAPFVPDASDTPEAIRTKLTQLAKFLKIENDALVGAPPIKPPADSGHEALSDEEFARQWKAGKRSWP